MEQWEFYRHMPVYLRDGRLLGRTAEIGHALDYLHIQQGHLLVWDWYVPVTAIEDVTPAGVRLKVSIPEMRRNRWHVPPESYLMRQGSTPGYEYTSPADIPGYEDTHEPDAGTV